jgi:hypothetical protein
MMEKEPRKENSLICSSCGQPINQANPEVGWINFKGHSYHTDHFSLRPRWELKDKDTGIAFYRKGDKHMDIIEGEDEYRGVKYKDIIIYDSNLTKDVMVRTKKEPLNGKIK